VSSFIGWVISQNQVVNFRHEQHRATEIAEAGLNYYRWYLAHHPNDSTTSTSSVYSDPESGPIGEYTLTISRNSFCGSTASIEVESTAFTYDDPSAVSTISARYSQPTVAEYSFITNSGVWFGGGVVLGPIHSNQGLRMEAAHNSTVGSGQASWNCDSTYGCSPAVPNAPGVYSSGSLSSPGLFEYPVSPIDFTGLTLDLADMKNRAENNGGIYYPPTSGFGYLVTFNGDSTIDVDRVTGTRQYWSYDADNGWNRDERNVITATAPIISGQPIDNDCPVLYFEDKTWVQGDIDQKVTIAAADLGLGTETNIVLNGDIEYVSGADAGLLAIAEDDVDINLVVNDGLSENLTLNGIFIQNGRFGRNGYVTFSWPRLPVDLRPFAYLNNLTILGTQVSNTRAVVSWTGWSGFAGSGGGSSFDRNQIDNPPPLTPTTNDVYELQNWRQEG
jgi:hypothetical protein